MHRRRNRGGGGALAPSLSLKRGPGLSFLHSVYEYYEDCILVSIPMNLQSLASAIPDLLSLLARLMGQYYFARWRLSLSSVRICNTTRPACRRLQPCRPGDDVMPPSVTQSNYSSTVALHGGPVGLRPVRATFCHHYHHYYYYLSHTKQHKHNKTYKIKDKNTYNEW